MRVALKKLGFEDTYHMDNVIENPSDIDFWTRAYKAKFCGEGKPFGREEWDQLLGHCQAVCDVPTAAFIPELLAAYPDALLILTPRDATAWYASCRSTIQAAVTAPTLRYLSYLETGFLGRFIPLLELIFVSVFPCPPSSWPTPEGERIWIEHYNRGHEEARALVPESKRLEFRLQQGWGPLCEFLGVEVPCEEFPHVNEGKNFGRKIALLKTMAIERIAKRWAPFVGLLAVGAVVWGRSLRR
ncbi:MAG: hypothetical protein Q9217_007039 [Psora testacea]